MKWSENRIESMILRKKVVSLKNIYVNENHWVCTLQSYTVWKSLVEITHMLMEISLNLVGFTDFFYKEMLTSLISLSSRNIFWINMLLKTSVVENKSSDFLNFFLRDQPYLFRDISQTSELKFTKETFSASSSFVHFDGLCNYLHLFQKQPADNFFKNKCCFPDQEDVGYYINKSTETGLDFFIKYLLRAI